jgi:hypothetical protein
VAGKPFNPIEPANVLAKHGVDANEPLPFGNRSHNGHRWDNRIDRAAGVTDPAENQQQNDFGTYSHNPEVVARRSAQPATRGPGRGPALHGIDPTHRGVALSVHLRSRRVTSSCRMAMKHLQLDSLALVHPGESLQELGQGVRPIGLSRMVREAASPA